MHVCRVVDGGADVFLHAVDGGAHFLLDAGVIPSQQNRIEIIYVVLIRNLRVAMTHGWK